MNIYILAIILLLFFFGLANYLRAKTQMGNPLRPNCLLTRHPIVFLEGRPSLFYFLKYWNQLPDFLQDHGYEVLELPFGGLSQESRRRHLSQFLQRKENKKLSFHLVSDSSLNEDCEWALEFLPNSVQSITTIASNRESLPIRKAELKPTPSYQVIAKKSKITSSATFFWLLLLQIHKIYTHKPKFWSGAVLDLPTNHNSQLRKTVLNHMIFLAESDLQCSH